MSLPAVLQGNLSLPVICSPLFIISNPDLVIAQCKAGVVGSFPALNARPAEVLDEWLQRITTELADYQAALQRREQAAPQLAVTEMIELLTNGIEEALCRGFLDDRRAVDMAVRRAGSVRLNSGPTFAPRPPRLDPRIISIGGSSRK